MIQDTLVARSARLDQRVQFVSAVHAVLKESVIGRFLTAVLAGDDFLKPQFVRRWLLDRNSKPIGD